MLWKLSWLEVSNEPSAVSTESIFHEQPATR